MKVKSIKVTVDREAMTRLERAYKRALDLTAEAILSDIKARAVIPKDTGELERSGFIDISFLDVGNIISIIFDTPYARRWYFNLDHATFQKTKNANASDHWMDYYLDGEGKQWIIDTYAKFLKQESGGLIK